MFVEMEESKVFGYHKGDGCYGTVQNCCQTGAFLTLDNGELAFAYNFGNLRPGTEVLCTVKKPAFGDQRMRVTIDSVCYQPIAA